jgi:hypothetical protein
VNKFTETVVLDAAASIRETSDGYLVCSPRIARTGIQVYQGFEVGRPDLKEVSVYRPDAEVFHQDAIASLAHKPVTNEHPEEPVNASNWRDISVGHLGGEILRDGEFVRVPLVLMDADAISEVKGGKTQLSVGYSAQLTWGDGTTPTGEKYQATQTDIRANHVAITRTARGGPKLRMGDRSKPKEKTMTIRSKIFDGITVDMEERDMQVVERHTQKLENDLDKAQKDLFELQETSKVNLAKAQTEVANGAALIQTKDAEIATLKQQLADSKLSPQQLDKMVGDRVATVQRAKTILGDSLVLDNKTDMDIKRQVVNAKLGDTAKDWNDDMVTASFNTLTVADTGNNNGIRQVNEVLHLQNNNGNDPRAKAYNEYEENISNRWKTGGSFQKAAS